MSPSLVTKLAKVARGNALTWRYLVNLRPTLAYQIHRDALSDDATRVLKVLRRDGVAVTSAEALLGPDSCFPELSAAVEQLERELHDVLATARAEANHAGHEANEKTYREQSLALMAPRC